MAQSPKRLAVFFVALILPLGSMVGAPRAQAVTSRHMEVRPITLKVELFSSLLEIYQANVSHAGIWHDVYQNEMAANKAAADHYQWLQKTYRAFDPRMREELEFFFFQSHAWNYVDLLLDLPDNSTIDGVIAFLMQVPEARLVEALGPEAAEPGFRGRLSGFLARFHNDFFADYSAARVSESAARARKMNALPDFDILQFMEQQTGIDPWPASQRTVFYLTTAYMGSMGFERDNASYCLLQANVATLPEVLGTAFHEYGHMLFRPLMQSEGFETLSARLLTAPELAEAQMEFSDTYSPQEFVEENLVDGCSLYLLFRHGDVTPAWLQKVPVYTEFEREYAMALTKDFDPDRESLTRFTRRFIDGFIRDQGL